MGTKYYIAGGRYGGYTPTKARTLRGAMRAATNFYEVAHGGRIEIAEIVNNSYVTVAVKKSTDAWDHAK